MSSNVCAGLGFILEDRTDKGTNLVVGGFSSRASSAVSLTESEAIFWMIIFCNGNLYNNFEAML